MPGGACALSKLLRGNLRRQRQLRASAGRLLALVLWEGAACVALVARRALAAGALSHLQTSHLFLCGPRAEVVLTLPRCSTFLLPSWLWRRRRS